MKTLKYFFGIMLMVCIPFAANAQFMFGGGNRPNQDSLRRITAADYADMLAKVGVGKPREGRLPNSPDESEHPNYDELTANPLNSFKQYLYLRLGFLGNQPLSTRFFCSKSSPMPQRAEAPKTPTTAEIRVFSINKAATIAAKPITKYTIQGRVPQ